MRGPRVGTVAHCRSAAAGHAHWRLTPQISDFRRRERGNRGNAPCRVTAIALARALSNSAHRTILTIEIDHHAAISHSQKPLTTASSTATSLTDRPSMRSHLVTIIEPQGSMLHITCVVHGAIFAGGVGPSVRGNTVADDTPYTLARFGILRCRDLTSRRFARCCTGYPHMRARFRRRGLTSRR